MRLMVVAIISAAWGRERSRPQDRTSSKLLKHKRSGKLVATLNPRGLIQMLLKNRLFTPGPTPILPAAQTALASFSLHHRTAEFRALFTRVLNDMKEFIGTKNDVLVLASSR